MSSPDETSASAADFSAYNVGKLKRSGFLINKFLGLGLMKKNIIIVLMTFILVLITSMGLFYWYSWSFKIQADINNLKSIADEKKETLSLFFTNLDTLAYNISYSRWMQRLFMDNRSPMSIQNDISSVQYFLNSLSVANSGVQFAVITNSGTRIRSEEQYDLDYSIQLEEKDWFDELLIKKSYLVIGKNNSVYLNEEGIIASIYYIIRDYNTLEVSGTLIISLTQEILETYLSTINIRSYCVLAPGDNLPLVGVLPDNMENPMLEDYPVNEVVRNAGGDYYLFKDELIIKQAKMPLLVLLSENPELFSDRGLKIMMVGILLILGFFLTIMAMTFSRYLTVPILNCISAMNEIKNNNMGIMIENPYQDEIGDLINGFNEMSGSIASLIEKNKIISVLQKETEFRMLECQVNPHFLFNTLEMINGCILSDENDKAVAICESLGSLYRYNLKIVKWVSIAEELDYIQKYLLIMKQKLKDMSVFYDIGGAIHSHLLLKFTLQPLVENSVLHGFREKDEECCLSLSLQIKSEILNIEITDNGDGMDEETMAQIRAEITDIYRNPTQKVSFPEHIGISNVVQRLYLEYGDKMKFEIQSKKKAGTRISISMPSGGSRVQA